MATVYMHYEKALVMINQFYYPSWQATLVSSAQRLDARAATPEGLVEVWVPPGQEEVRLDICVGTAERVGRWISALSALLGIILVWSGVGRSTHKEWLYRVEESW